MPSHKNFFETLAESQLRLLGQERKGSIVLYDGEPYYVLAVTDHKGDGHFRIYMEALGNRQLVNSYKTFPTYSISHEDYKLGPALDVWMENNPGKIVRKHMSSPKFNRYRPFPLGNLNTDYGVVHSMRSSTRRVEQGLTSNMVYFFGVGEGHYERPTLTGPEMRDAIIGKYPSLKKVFAQYASGSVAAPRSTAFDRDLSVVKGPVDSLFLGYKTELVAQLPHGDADKVVLGSDYKYLAETIEETDLFKEVV